MWPRTTDRPRGQGAAYNRRHCYRERISGTIDRDAGRIRELGVDGRAPVTSLLGIHIKE
jgi:hypothetical protein